MATTQYIGSRYVPLFADPAEWSKENTYEPLTIVLHEGNSYTSRQFVPVGIDIENDAFWAETGNYNAQVEQYRQEVLGFREETKKNAAAITAETEARESADATLTESVESEATAREAAATELEGKISAETEARENAVSGIETAYKAADSALESKITAETTARESADKTLTESVTRIEVAYKAADTELEGKISAETEARKTADEELEAKITGEMALKIKQASVPSHLEGARFLLREEIDETVQTAQGMCVFPPENPQYIARAFNTIDGTSCNVSVYSYSTHAKVSEITGNYGHGGTISYNDGKLYVTAFNEANLMHVFTVKNGVIAYDSVINTGSYYPLGYYKDNKLLVAIDWTASSNLYSYDISTGATEAITSIPSVEVKDYAITLMQMITYDPSNDWFIALFSDNTPKAMFFTADHSFVKAMTFEPYYMYAAVIEMESIQTYGDKIWFNNNPTGFASLEFRHIHNVWEGSLSNPSANSVKNAFPRLSNITVVMDDSADPYIAMDDVNNEINNWNSLSLKYTYDLSGFIACNEAIVHIAQEAKGNATAFTAELIFANLNGKQIWCSMAGQRGGGFYFLNGNAYLRGCDEIVKNASDLKHTVNNKKTVCCIEIGSIYLQQAPTSTDIYAAWVNTGAVYLPGSTDVSTYVKGSSCYYAVNGLRP